MKTINIPETIETLDRKVFYCCENLETVHFSDGLKKIEEMAFSSCRKIERLTLPNSLKAIGKEALHGISTVVIPNSVNEIAEDALSEYSTIEVVPDSFAESFCKRKELRHKYNDSNVFDIRADRIDKARKMALSNLSRTYFDQIVGEVIKVEGHFRNIGYSYNGYPSFEAIIQTEAGRTYTLYFGGPFHNEGKKLKSGHYMSPFYHEACEQVIKGKIIIVQAPATNSYIKICDCASFAAYSYEQNRVIQYVEYSVFDPLTGQLYNHKRRRRLL